MPHITAGVWLCGRLFLFSWPCIFRSLYCPPQSAPTVTQCLPTVSQCRTPWARRLADMWIQNLSVMILCTFLLLYVLLVLKFFPCLLFSTFQLESFVPLCFPKIILSSFPSDVQAAPRGARLRVCIIFYWCFIMRSGRRVKSWFLACFYDYSEHKVLRLNCGGGRLLLNHLFFL